MAPLESLIAEDKETLKKFITQYCEQVNQKVRKTLELLIHPVSIFARIVDLSKITKFLVFLNTKISREYIFTRTVFLFYFNHFNVMTNFSFKVRNMFGSTILVSFTNSFLTTSLLVCLFAQLPSFEIRKGIFWDLEKF